MDNLFKALLVIILVAFLYLYYENMDNNRFQNMPSEHTIMILDTRTGIPYEMGNINTKRIFHEYSYIYDLPNSIIDRVEIN